MGSSPMDMPPEMSITFRDEHQKQLYNKVKEFVNSSKNTLLVSGPPGSGKTFITLNALLQNYEGKIITILRTHSQQDHYKKLFSSDFLPIRGIEYHCKVPQVKMHPLASQLCKWMRLGKHRACRGCPYRVQFLSIPNYKVVSFLYSHSAELIKSILDNLKENYIIVFDEYHHCLPREQRISKHFIQLAEAEYGEELKLRKSENFDEEEINKMGKKGERNWKKIGYSYLLHITETIEYLQGRNRWFYKADDDYCYIDDSIYSLINIANMKKVFISATPLPEIPMLSYDNVFNMTPILENIAFLIYTGFKFNFETRSDERIIKHIRKLLYHLGKYKAVIFFPSKSALNSVYMKLPENFTIDPSEFPEKNTLLVAGGKYSEGIDLPQDIEVIAVIGIPYDDPLFRNPYLRELFRYFKMYDVQTRKLLYDYKALLKVIQSLGRGIRDIKQKIVIVLADRRYSDERWLEYFPEWLQYNITRFRSVNDIEMLDEFITRYFLGLNGLEWIDEKYKEQIFGIE